MRRGYCRSAAKSRRHLGLLSSPPDDAAYTKNLFGHVGPAWQVLYSVCLWLGLVAFSWVWMTLIGMGPMEWLWRTLTYGRAPAMRGTP